ncbi:HlyC/CorC family transporter [Gammaproteobacteria bacterium]
MINDVPLGFLFVALGFCILMAAFCSIAEAGFMTLNRHRLRHLYIRGNPRAILVSKLLERPDRLMGLLLFGNTFFRVCAAGLAALLGWRMEGDLGIALAAVLLSLVVLVVGDLVPKAVAILHPEEIGLTAAPILLPLTHLLKPLIWVLNFCTRILLRLFLVFRTREETYEESSTTEVAETLPRRPLGALVGFLELQNLTVEDVMVPRGGILAIDLEDPWSKTLARLTRTRHTCFPVYQENLDRVEGILHVRDILSQVTRPNFDPRGLREVLRESYFVPVGTPLHTQLLHFQQHGQELGLVVNEYGDILGLLTLQDILAEVVGELTLEPAIGTQDFSLEPEGTYLVNGGVSLRDLNRQTGWQLPTNGPKTLNGLILEHREALPEAGTRFSIAGYPIEVVEIGSNVVKTVRVRPESRWS